MQDAIAHHTRMLRQCAALAGTVEIMQAGCDSPTSMFIGQLLISTVPDHAARNAIRQAQQRALIAAAIEDSDHAAAGRHAAEQAALIITAWAKVFVEIERGGGSVSYRSNE